DAMPEGDDVRLKLRVGPDGARHVVVSGGDDVRRGSDTWSFMQVNTQVAGMLRSAVISAIDPGRVLDLYAGAGDTAIPLAPKGCGVALVELDARAVNHAEETAKHAGVRVKCIVGRVEDHLEHLLPAATVIVNPPRSGLSQAVTDRLTARPPDRLV